MDRWRGIYAVVLQNLKNLLFSARLYVVFLTVFLCLFFFTDGLHEYLYINNMHIGIWELLPIFVNSRLTNLTIFLGWIILVSDIPFFSCNSMNILIRTSRKMVMIGCSLYVFILSIIYIVFLQNCCVCIAGLNYISVENRWSDSFTMAARYGANVIGIETNLQFDIGVIGKNSPFEIWIMQIIILILFCSVIGLLYICGIMLRGYYFWSHILTVGSWFWDFIITEGMIPFFYKPKYLWISPISLAKYRNLTIGKIERGPSVLHVVILFSCIIVALFYNGCRQIAIYDFSKD